MIYLQCKVDIFNGLVSFFVKSVEIMA